MNAIPRPTSKDYYDFACAYRTGPWEKFAELKAIFLAAGEDIVDLTNRADTFFETGDKMRQALRSGKEGRYLPAIEAFRQASNSLHLDENYIDKLIADQKALLIPDGSAMRR